MECCWGSFWYGESEKTLHERRKAPESFKSWSMFGVKNFARVFLNDSGPFRRSWIVFSDSPYDMDHIKNYPQHHSILLMRCYVPFAYFHVSHANFGGSREFSIWGNANKGCTIMFGYSKSFCFRVWKFDYVIPYYVIANFVFENKCIRFLTQQSPSSNSSIRKLCYNPRFVPF